MWHSKRIWMVVPAASAETLAEQLTRSTWTGCSGFELGGYLFVNDATSADGAQEYGVLRRQGDHYVQIESLTFSWMTTKQALTLIRAVLAGTYDEEDYDVVSASRIQTPAEHGRCHHCA